LEVAFEAEHQLTNLAVIAGHNSIGQAILIGRRRYKALQVILPKTAKLKGDKLTAPRARMTQSKPPELLRVLRKFDDPAVLA
jgi:hypothetical protein